MGGGSAPMKGPGLLLKSTQVSMIPDSSDKTQNLAEGGSFLLFPLRWKYILDTLPDSCEGFKKVPYGILFSRSLMAPPQSPCKEVCVCWGPGLKSPRAPGPWV